MTPRTMALAVDWIDGRVRLLPDEAPEPWLDVLERAGEAAECGAVATIGKVRGHLDELGRELYRVHTEWTEEPGSGVIPIKVTDYYLVGELSPPRERDPDAVREWEYDR